MKKTTIFCIIVTYNAMKWIDRCLGSLQQSSIPVIPIIIDNCSKDDTVEYIHQNYPSVQLIENKINRGFGQANNQGIEVAYEQGGTHFFLLNQDASIFPDTIEKLVDVQDRYNLALVSPIHLNGKGNIYDYNFYVNVIIDENNRSYVSDLTLNTVKPFYTVFKINAAAWMLSRHTIENIGGFDPIYFHYGEDGNYCQRIKYHKEQIAFVPTAFICHDREFKGNINIYNKSKTKTMLLYYYSDINNHHLFMPTIIKAKLHLHNLFSAIKLLLQLDLKDLGNLINGYASFINKYPQMVRNMKTNKRIGANWLKI